MTAPRPACACRRRVDGFKPIVDEGPCGVFEASECCTEHSDLCAICGHVRACHDAGRDGGKGKGGAMKTRDGLIQAGIRNLREFGYPDVNAENILTDRVYSAFFVSMLRDSPAPDARELADEIEKAQKDGPDAAR